MSFSVPNITPFTLPSIPPASVITSTLNGLTPPIPDSAFLTNVLSTANTDFIQKTDGLFTNPLFDHMKVVDSAISSLKPLTSLASAADALPGAPGGASAALTTVMSHMTDLTTMFSNMATNIVPVQLPMNPLIKSAIGSMSSIGTQSAEAMKSVPTFIQNMGIPSMGTVLNQASSEFSLNQQCGTVSPTNPAPMLSHYATMLSSMASTAMNFLKTVGSAISNVITSAVTAFHSAITGLLSTVEGAITSFAAPIASFGSEMFNSIKNQMATGTATLLRHMTETNPTLAFNITGAVPTTLGGLTGSIGSNVSSATSAITGAASSGASSASSALGSVSGTVGSAVSSATGALSGVSTAIGSVVSSAEHALGGLGGFAGLVTPGFASILTKFPSPAKQAATSVPAPTPVTNAVVTAVAKTSPDATATQLQAIAAQITLAKNDATAASAVAETAAQALQAYMSAQNYAAIKNAQFDSPIATAAYQNAKTALLASPQYLAMAAANKDYETKRDAYGQLIVIQGYMQRNGPYPSNPNGPWYANGVLLVPPPTNPVL